MKKYFRTNSLEDRGKIRIDISTPLRKAVFAIAVFMILYGSVMLVLDM